MITKKFLLIFAVGLIVASCGGKKNDNKTGGDDGDSSGGSSSNEMIQAPEDPEKAGIYMADKWHKYDMDYVNSVNSEISSFLSGVSKYSTRVEARNAYKKIFENAELERARKRQTLEAEYMKLENKYSEDRNKYETFFATYDAQMRKNGEVELDTTGIGKRINSAILTIIPPVPNAEKIKKDLVGQTWYDVPTGYFEKGTIEPDEIQGIEIVSSGSPRNTKYDVNVVLTLQKNVNSVTYKIDADLVYLLGDYDDWKLESIKTNKVSVKPTTDYVSYITKTDIYDRYYLNNTSSMALLVGITVIPSYGESYKKAVTISGNSDYFIDYYVKEIRIDFVERP